MNYSEIITILLKVLAAVTSLAVTWLVPRVKVWLEGRISAQELAKIVNYIQFFVEAAELQLKSCDPTGAERKQYVIEQLTALGIIVTQEVDALIEAKVLELNKTTS